MKTLINPERNLWTDLTIRGTEQDQTVTCTVERIIDRIRLGSDKELLCIEEEISGYRPSPLEVSQAEIIEAEKSISKELKDSIRHAMDNIRAFHEAQLPTQIEVETCPGVKCIQRPVPIPRIGLYIPGGTAPLFSTVLMLAVPASIAGCKEKILCTPCDRNGQISAPVLYTAHVCGVDHIFRTSGAQAIAAMAFGTESIPKVDKIFGPGNRYVTTAKQILGGRVVSIDMPAGPSEVMIIADSTSNAEFVAADLLSQAEHGKDSQVVLIANNRNTIENVMSEVKKQLLHMERKEIIECALNNSMCIMFDSTNDIIDFANHYAPEHLIVCSAEPWAIVERITSAGSIFVGPYTPESAGDYASGTNHTLPTSSWARSVSGLNIDSFMRKMTIQTISRDGLESISKTIITMAEAEGLKAHSNAVKIRLND